MINMDESLKISIWVLIVVKLQDQYTNTLDKLLTDIIFVGRLKLI